jgi:RNA polymerase sigma-70 factor (ECF subfamily)
MKNKILFDKFTYLCYPFLMGTLDIAALKDDKSLLEGCVDRDEAAWSELVKKYWELIGLAIECRLKKYGFKPAQHDIDDIRQDVLVSIWEDGTLSDVKKSSSLPYWLATVSGNAALDHMKDRKWRDPPRSISLSDRKDGLELADIIPSGKPHTCDELARRELLIRAEESIESLPFKEKLIIKLHLLHDKRFHEIADILKIPEGTVSSYVKRAKEKLRDLLKDS